MKGQWLTLDRGVMEGQSVGSEDSGGLDGSSDVSEDSGWAMRKWSYGGRMNCEDCVVWGYGGQWT